MMTPESRPDDSGPEVMEALDRLGDDDRSLILEHYFEKATLEELARREGLSIAGVWKRLELAKGRLKKALIGAGFTLTAANLAQALESASPVPAPAGLIGSAVLSKAALVAAGGFVVATKSVAIGTAVAVAVLFLLLGGGGGYWIASKRAIEPQTPKGTTAKHPPSTADVELDSGRAPEREAKSAEASAAPAPGRLAQFRTWHAAWVKEAGNYPDKRSQEFFSYQQKLYDQAPEMRRAVMDDIKAFLEFARAPESETCLSHLLGIALFRHVRQDWGWHREFVEYDRFPPELMEGLIDLLVRGTEAQKLAVVRAGAYFHNHSAAFLDACRDLLASGHEEMQLQATYVLLGKGLSEAELNAVRSNAENTRGLELRRMSYQAIGRTGTPENVGWLLDRLGRSFDGTATQLAGYSLRNFVVFQKGIPRDMESKAAASVIQALSGRPDMTETDFDDLMYIGLNLSENHARPVLDAAVAQAPSDLMRRAATRVRSAFQEGERNSLKLMSEYREGKKAD